MPRPNDPTVADLVKLRPAKLRVSVRESDEAKIVAVPTNRKRWAKLAETLDSLDWERIEALDAKGAILGVVNHPETLESVDIEVEDTDARVERLLALMLKAQQMALAAQRDQLAPLLNGVQAAVGVMTEALGAVAQMYRLALTTATALPVGDGPADDGLGKFMQTVMMLKMGATGVLPAAQPSRSVNGASTGKSRTTPPPATGPAQGPTG